jgi:hypothetical protein
MTFSQKAVELLPQITSKPMTKEVVSWICGNLVLDLTERQKGSVSPGIWPLYPSEASPLMSKEEYWDLCNRIDSALQSVPNDVVNSLEEDWPWTQAF